jgi:predicted DNA-binding protein (MmcQ/YjbR family)
MDMEALRCYCLSLPCATEDVKWGDNLLFRVGEKMFAIASLDRTPVSIVFKCAPEEFAELVEREGIVPAPYLARNSWVMLESLNSLPRIELKRLINDSHALVASKLPKKTREKLGIT